MNLNFGGLGDINPTSKKGLRPYGIYLVQLKSVETKEGKGKQDPDTTWKSLVLHFEGEQGTYQESLFYPNENSAKRYEGKRTHSSRSTKQYHQTVGGKWQKSPSLSRKVFY